MRTALIVGGANGIGLSIALQMVQRQDYAKVYIVDRAVPESKYTANEKIESYVFDLTESDYSFFDSFADVDTLMITAGFGKLALFADLDEEYIINSMNVNATAVMRIPLILPSRKLLA